VRSFIVAESRRAAYDRYGTTADSSSCHPDFSACNTDFTFRDAEMMFREFFGGRDPFEVIFNGREPFEALFAGRDPFEQFFSSSQSDFSSFYRVSTFSGASGLVRRFAL
jgi:DnaJ-class molecular chaperone